MIDKRIIYFDEAAHKYTDEFGNKYTSVTTYLGNFEEKFDTVKMARACSRKGEGIYAGKTPQQIEEMWLKMNKEACDKGNTKHNFLETTIKKSNGFYNVDVNGNIKGALYTINDIIANPEFGWLDKVKFDALGIAEKYPTIYDAICYLCSIGYRLYSEIGVYNPEYMISGLIDLLLIRGNEFIILDWKTNIDPLRYDAGYYKKDMSGNRTENWITTNEKFKYPLNMYEKSHGWGYTFQLSSYAYLVECFGLRCTNLTLAHIRDTKLSINKEVVEWHEIKYLKNEVKKAMEVFVKQQRSQKKTQFSFMF